MVPPVVPLSWWYERAADVVLVDVRFYLDGRSARAAYEEGHLPGARFAEFEYLSDSSDPSRGRNRLPTPETFAEGMRRLGVGDDDVVLGYDDAGGVTAARLVWMLRAVGHPAALVDGGLRAWTGEVERGAPPQPARGAFTARPWPADRLVDLESLGSLGPGTVLLDARAADRFAGADDPVDPRPGHIPGAANLPCRSNLQADGTLLPPEELRRRFSEVGVASGSDVVSYCGSGITACHNLLAMEHAGLGPGRLYAGSWSEYSRSDLPVETSEQPAVRR